jgi:uncharacterized protein (TIGR02118 family)
MVKLIALLKRKPGMTREAFNERWLVEHTRLSSQLPDCVDYRINLCSPDQYAGGEEPAYDGTAELWWTSRQAMEASFASQPALIAGADADAFCSARVHLVTEEFQVIAKGVPVQPPRSLA